MLLNETVSWKYDFCISKDQLTNVNSVNSWFQYLFTKIMVWLIFIWLIFTFLHICYTGPSLADAGPGARYGVGPPSARLQWRYGGWGGSIPFVAGRGARCDRTSCTAQRTALLLHTVKLLFEDYWSKFYKKILFQSFYFKLSCLIQSVTWHFFVIIWHLLTISEWKLASKFQIIQIHVCFSLYYPLPFCYVIL